MGKIFISYRREDTIDVTGRIFDWLALRLPTDQIFLDIDNIPPGADFRTYIEGAIRQTSVMLVVIGQRWLANPDTAARRIDSPNDFVRMEIESALHHKIPVVPIVVQGAAMPAPTHLPDTLATLAYRNAIFVRSGADFRHDMERVAKAVESFAPDLRIAPDPLSVAAPTSIPTSAPTQTAAPVYAAPAPLYPAMRQPKPKRAPGVAPWSPTLPDPNRAMRQLAWVSVILGLIGLAVTALFLAFPASRYYGDSYTLSDGTHSWYEYSPNYTYFQASYSVAVAVALLTSLVPLIYTFRRARLRGNKRLSVGMLIGSILLFPLSLGALPALLFQMGDQRAPLNDLKRLAQAALYLGGLGMLLSIGAANYYRHFYSYDSVYGYDNYYLSAWIGYFSISAAITLLFSLVPAAIAFRHARLQRQNGAAWVTLIATILLGPALLAGLPSWIYAYRALKTPQPPISSRETPPAPPVAVGHAPPRSVWPHP